MPKIFKPIEQFVEAVLYDGSEDSYQQVKDFIEKQWSVNITRNDAGYLLIVKLGDESGEHEIVQPDVYFIQINKNSGATMYKSMFETLFYQPSYQHN